mmetsp:Transcript_19321/g.27962  ORF Transcript_19321/g.27962 Transcript_19321/m.27962 type:complete len:294 (-) Transcript_19321:1650-2531(-)
MNFFGALLASLAFSSSSRIAAAFSAASSDPYFFINFRSRAESPFFFFVTGLGGVVVFSSCEGVARASFSEELCTSTVSSALSLRGCCKSFDNSSPSTFLTSPGSSSSSHSFGISLDAAWDDDGCISFPFATCPLSRCFAVSGCFGTVDLPSKSPSFVFISLSKPKLSSISIRVKSLRSLACLATLASSPKRNKTPSPISSCVAGRKFFFPLTMNEPTVRYSPVGAVLETWWDSTHQADVTIRDAQADDRHIVKLPASRKACSGNGKTSVGPVPGPFGPGFLLRLARRIHEAAP